jgi:amino acid transporter
LTEAAVPATLVQDPAGAGPGQKGLKRNAIGFLSSTVIGVASTAPGYSLAATLGFIAAAVGVFTPAILWVAFIPMLLIATSYYYMNRADPDCGTTFTWVTRGLGRHLGLARRLGDRGRRRGRDGEPRADRRAVHVTQNPIGSIHVSWEWFEPWKIQSFNAVIAGVLLAIFIYWGGTAA